MSSQLISSLQRPYLAYFHLFVIVLRFRGHLICSCIVILWWLIVSSPFVRLICRFIWLGRLGVMRLFLSHIRFLLRFLLWFYFRHLLLLFLLSQLVMLPTNKHLNFLAYAVKNIFCFFSQPERTYVQYFIIKSGNFSLFCKLTLLLMVEIRQFYVLHDNVVPWFNKRTMLYHKSCSACLISTKESSAYFATKFHLLLNYGQNLDSTVKPTYFLFGMTYFWRFAWILIFWHCFYAFSFRFIICKSLWCFSLLICRARFIERFIVKWFVLTLLVTISEISIHFIPVTMALGFILLLFLVFFALPFRLLLMRDHFNFYLWNFFVDERLYFLHLFFH